MDKFQFNDAITRLCRYWSKEPPTKEQLAGWYRHVERIPGGGPLDYILTRVEQEHEMFPRNLGKAFNAFWEEWQARHPQAMRQEMTSATCPDGCMDGLIFTDKIVADPERGIMHRIDCVWRCSRCNRSAANGIAANTVADLKRAGWAVNIGMPGVYALSSGNPARSVAAVIEAAESKFDSVPF